MIVSCGGLGGPSLQWGRGIAAAESLLAEVEITDAAGLQWGRGIAAAESWMSTGKHTPCLWLQWGRGIAAAESISVTITWTHTFSASMGPRHRCRGIFDQYTVLGGINNLLQWGRGIAAAESPPDASRHAT